MAVEADGRPGPPLGQGLRVVEVAVDPAGEMAGKVLGQYGAAVVKVEPPGGSPTRRVGPFAGGREDPDTSLNFWYYNTGKRSTVLDLPRERPALDRLLGEADVLITSLPRSGQRRLGLDPAAISGQFPQLVVCALTPFGQDGPWSEYENSDLVALAAGGLLNSCGYDDHSIPPIRPAENQAYHVAASFAHISIFLALIEREQTGRGQVIDLAVHDSVAMSPELANPYWFYPKAIVKRQTCRHAQPTPTQPAIFPTLDGRYVYFTLILADIKPWESLVEWMDSLGFAADLTDPAYRELSHRQANFPHIQQMIEAFFLIQDADTIYHDGQGRGLPIAVINSPDDVLADEHLRARRFFETVEHPDGTVAEYPGPPIRFSSSPSVPPAAAPRLGSSPAGDLW
ncbi:MAG TPA: CoA transferase [Acidimicrobiales bacterium]|nr:CoA transferase [Acidimicrobiales bacterium]